MAVPKTLAELTYQVAVELKAIREGTLTTGSATVPADYMRTESADYWNKGTFWILSHAASAAPYGEMREITDFTQGNGSSTGGVFTLKTALTATSTATDRYAVCRRRYPNDVIVAHVNSAYRDLGEVPTVDDTTLDTEENRTEYTIPDAACKDLREVWMQTEDTQTYVKGWWKVPKGEWRQTNATLYVPQYSAGYNIRLVYMAEPAMLTADTSEISEFVHPNRIIYKAAAGCLMWRADRLTSTSVINALNQRINYLLDQDQKAAYKWPIVAPKKDNKLFLVSFTGDRDDAEVIAPTGYVHLG